MDEITILLKGKEVFFSVFVVTFWRLTSFISVAFIRVALLVLEILIVSKEMTLRS